MTGFIAAVAIQAVSAQTSTARTPWGEPDLQGTWTSEGELSVPFERPREYGDRQLLSDAELAARRATLQKQTNSDNAEFDIDTADRSIVISGDTTPTERLVALARRADVLVHEALYDAAAVDRLVASVPNASDLRRSMLSHHTTAEDAGRIAAEAGVGTLVLSHLIPAEDPAVTDEMWTEAARRHFRGRVVVAKDLMEL